MDSLITARSLATAAAAVHVLFVATTALGTSVHALSTILCRPAKAPNPSQQGINFRHQFLDPSPSSSTEVAVVFGRRFQETGDGENNEWCPVGYVSVDRDGADADADADADGAMRGQIDARSAVICQRKLVQEYACGLHRSLRSWKKDGNAIELGILCDELSPSPRPSSPLSKTPSELTAQMTNEEGATTEIRPVEWSKAESSGDSSANDDDASALSICGFLGLLNDSGYQNPKYQQIHSDIADRRAGILPIDYYQTVYEGNETKVPWNIGSAQPRIVTACKEQKFKGRILDAGCGMGENSIFLASQKQDIDGAILITSVLGFDVSDEAVRIAQERASKEGRNTEMRPVRFVAASCVDFSDHPEIKDSPLFDTSIDSGLLHCLNDEDAHLYARELAKVVKPDVGRAFVGCFSTKNPDPWDNPRRISVDDLKAYFSEENGWEIVSIKDDWWARPSARGSSNGSFSMAHWMEARRLPM